VFTEVQSTEELHHLLLDDDTASDLLQQTGYRKPVTNITLTDRPGLMSVLVDYHIKASRT
jgi:hypothetical protein